MAEADPDIAVQAAPIAEREIAGAGPLDEAVRGAREPFVVRGLVADWPLVRAGLNSADDARAYLLRKRRDVPFTVSLGESGAGGRLFYDDSMGMNFRSGRGRLDDIFSQMAVRENDPDCPAVYLASIDTRQFFDGLDEDHPIPLGDRDLLKSIWIGTRTRIAAHNDFPDNLACCAVGRRRFTLFPPEQFRNLYLGPVDNTPAGRAISMVDFHAPDFARFPRFREALQHAQITELEPGDALFIPSMWWHHVEGLAPFNVLMNYWWRDTPRWLGQPQDALNHAMLSIRDLPHEEKRIWRDLFDYYVFENDEAVTAHIPEKARSVLDRLTPQSASRIRNFILQQLGKG
ncbi:cupin-like domain-containing protein [Porphyrobacter algicida]|uniref:Cupin-like domain-containing protein n=1 Tax=Qipengyuania algicida TaxID=1836209 RepID=A0A845AG17_9SPHN|nr:cupin-like domain-containing protein [Qipengyuania algicida]